MNVYIFNFAIIFADHSSIVGLQLTDLNIIYKYIK